MPIPLPPLEEILRMRFAPEFWTMFVDTVTSLQEQNLLDPDDLDEPSAELFFYDVAAKMIDGQEDTMPSLDDTVKMVKIILTQEVLEMKMTLAVYDVMVNEMKEDTP